MGKGQRCRSTLTQAMAKGLVRQSETWREQDQRIRDKEVWTRGIWMNVLECIQCKKPVSCVNVHQWESIAEEALSNLEEKMIHCVGLGKHLSSASQWAGVQDKHGGRGRGYA